MLFTSAYFIVFFCGVFILYRFLPIRLSWIALLLASYFFYGLGGFNYLVLLASYTALHYITSNLIGKSQDETLRTRYLIISLGFSLLTLAGFKYSELWLGGALEARDTVSIWFPEIGRYLLPVGISFYTFQTLSYTIDVYYGRIKSEASFWKFALFVSYFPQLIMGPIERASALMPQFEKRAAFNYQQVVSGMRLVLWGFFKKLAVADRIAVWIDPTYVDVLSSDWASLIFAFVLFPIQVYADFSGYIDIARGCSRILGIHLSKNFSNPLFASSVTEFWRTWNITLSSWFRDYVFYPLFLWLKHIRLIDRLATRTKHNLSFILSLTVMFALLGVWHGARWQFLVLGGFQAVFIVCETYIKLPRLFRGDFMKPIRVLKTFMLFCITALLLRSDGLENAASHFLGLGSVDFKGISISRFELVTLGNSVLLFTLEQAMPNVSSIFIQAKGFIVIRWAAYLIIMALIGFTGVFHGAEEFIYMRF